jgi:hypothetical protein
LAVDRANLDALADLVPDGIGALLVNRYIWDAVEPKFQTDSCETCASAPA